MAFLNERILGTGRLCVQRKRCRGTIEQGRKTVNQSKENGTLCTSFWETYFD